MALSVELLAIAAELEDHVQEGVYLRLNDYAKRARELEERLQSHPHPLRVSIGSRGSADWEYRMRTSLWVPDETLQADGTLTVSVGGNPLGEPVEPAVRATIRIASECLAPQWSQDGTVGVALRLPPRESWQPVPHPFPRTFDPSRVAPCCVLLAKRPVDDGEVWYWQVRSEEHLWLVGLRCDEVDRLLEHWSSYPANQLPQWLRVRGAGYEPVDPPVSLDAPPARVV